MAGNIVEYFGDFISEVVSYARKTSGEFSKPAVGDQQKIAEV